MKQLSIVSIYNVLLVCCLSIPIHAQQKLTKASQSLKVDKTATINLNSDYTTVQIDTWNKDVIEVEAFIESDKLSKEELQSALEQWRVDVSGSEDYVTISSNGIGNNFGNTAFFDVTSMHALKDLECELAPIPPMPPLPNMSRIPMPELPPMPQMPELPELPEGIGQVDFDYETYKKEGEKYLDKWSKTYQKKYGKEYQEKMKAWAKKFDASGFDSYEKQMEAWGEKFGEEYGAKMEEWGKQFGESFGQDFEREMEAWGETFEAQMEAQEAQREARVHVIEQRVHAEERRSEAIQGRSESRGVSPDIKKTLIIHMPKKAKLKVNVKYGELQFVSTIENLKADMSHTKLTANTIDGSQTSINVSYAPVAVTNWNQGNLVLNFVEHANLNTVNRLVLNSNSSNIDLETINENVIINGSFGDLNIKNIADSFQNLSIVLENSDAVIALPESDYNLQYQGKQTRFKHPKKTSSEPVSTFSFGDSFSSKSIIVNAKFSKVLMK